MFKTPPVSEVTQYLSFSDSPPLDGAPKIRACRPVSLRLDNNTSLLISAHQHNYTYRGQNRNTPPYRLARVKSTGIVLAPESFHGGSKPPCHETFPGTSLHDAGSPAAPCPSASPAQKPRQEGPLRPRPPHLPGAQPLRDQAPGVPCPPPSDPPFAGVGRGEGAVAQETC